MRVAMLMADGFEESEFRHPYDELLAADHQVVVVGPVAGIILTGKKGTERKRVELAISSAESSSFDAVVIPGGYSPDRLRIMPDAVAFVAAMHAAGRLVATICHGPWLLIEAGLVQGRRLTGWASVRTDVLNAGGIWVDEPAVQDGLLITSRAPADLPFFTTSILRVLAEVKRPDSYTTATLARSGLQRQNISRGEIA